jgi:hypothetical protein
MKCLTSRLRPGSPANRLTGSRREGKHAVGSRPWTIAFLGLALKGTPAIISPRVGQRDPIAWQQQIDELRALRAEIAARVEQRKSTMPTRCARASCGIMPPV